LRSIYNKLIGLTLEFVDKYAKAAIIFEYPPLRRAEAGA
jgi:hypothetical protein